MNAETADAEAKYLLDQIEMKKANERRNEEKPGGCLTKSGGVFMGPSGKETYYNLKMDGVINNMRWMGFDEDRYPYWVREDGVKMFGAYVMVAANTFVRPKGTILETSLGMGMVVDHCVAAESEEGLIDIGVAW